MMRRWARCTRDIAPGEAVRRYGQVIGFASQPIRAGQHVHTRNLAMGDFARDYAFGQAARQTVRSKEPATSKALSAQTDELPHATTSESSPR
jgi:altronate hydrolase